MMAAQEDASESPTVAEPLKKCTKNEQINNIMSFSASSCTNQDTNKNQIGKNIRN